MTLSSWCFPGLSLGGAGSYSSAGKPSVGPPQLMHQNSGGPFGGFYNSSLGDQSTHLQGAAGWCCLLVDRLACFFVSDLRNQTLLLFYDINKTRLSSAKFQIGRKVLQLYFHVCIRIIGNWSVIF